MDDQARAIDRCDAHVSRRDRRVRLWQPACVSASVFVIELMMPNDRNLASMMGLAVEQEVGRS